MAKLSISLSDDLAEQLEALAKEKSKTVSGALSDILQAYFSKNSGDAPPPTPLPASTTKDSSGSKPSQEPPPVPNPSTPIEIRLEYFVAQVKELHDECQDLNERLESYASIVKEVAGDVGQFNERLSNLWHDVHSEYP